MTALVHSERLRVFSIDCSRTAQSRTVHANGSGAHGTLTITGDISKYAKAKCLQPGANSKMIARFSTVAGELGAADAERDVRGFALKCYTEEGNWDLLGNNTPAFFVRDPYKFRDFIHAQHKGHVEDLNGYASGAERRVVSSAEQQSHSGAYDLKLHPDVAARGVGVGTDCLVRFFRQSREIGLRHGLVLHAELDGEAEAAALTRTDGHRTLGLGFGRVFLVLLADIVERTAEAGGITRREEMFRGRGARLAWPAHSPRNGQVSLYRSIADLRVSVTSAGRSCGNGEERFDLIHGKCLRGQRASSRVPASNPFDGSLLLSDFMQSGE